MRFLDLFRKTKPDAPAEDEPEKDTIRGETERRKAEPDKDLSGCDLAVERLGDAVDERAKATDTLVGAIRRRSDKTKSGKAPAQAPAEA